MCKINCSGGCPECAPEEHAFWNWVGTCSYLIDSTMADPNEKEHHIAIQAFAAGYAAGEAEKC